MHDVHADAYRDTQRTRIARYLPGNADITATYSKLLNEVVQRPSR